MKNNAKFVLIRGLLRDARHWSIFPTLFQQRFPGADIITPDIPGNGRLNHLNSPNTVSGMTEALRKQIAIRQKLKLIAISMGGMIAVDWMTRYPEEIEAAVVINSSIGQLSPSYHRLRLLAWPYLVKMLFHSPMQREGDILALTSNKHGNDAALLAMWQKWQRQNPVSFANARNQCMAAIKFAFTPCLKQPVLVVASRKDRLVDYRCSVKLAQALHTKYVQHDTAGHDLPLDQPDWLADTIHKWIVSADF